MKEKKEEVEFLEYIYQIVQGQRENIRRYIKTREKTNEFTELLHNQLEEYTKICNSIKLMLQRRGKVVKDISLLSKMASYVSVKINIPEDETKENVIKILTHSSDMVVNQIDERLNDNKVNNKNILNLCERLKDVEKRNIANITK